MSNMNRIRQISAALIAVALLCAPSVRDAAAEIQLSVLPALNNITVGDEFDLSIDVTAEAGDLSCYAITLNFDTSLIEVVSSDEGALFSASLDPTFYQLETDPNGDSVLSGCVLGFGTSVLAPGQVATIRLRAIDDGNGTIDIVVATLRDVDRAVITPVVLSGSSVSIGVTSTPPPLSALRLYANPNPSRGAVSFVPAGFELSNKFGGNAKLQIADTSVELFDIAGRRLPSSVIRYDGSAFVWDGRDADGQSVAQGSYFAVLRVGDRILARTKLVRLD